MTLKKLNIYIGLLMILFGGFGTYHFKLKLRQINYKNKSDVTSLYLPKIEYVKLITFGFEKFTSDILWFRTINYFGSQMAKSESIPWFDHMCNLVTELNPKARSHYDFCSSLTSWIAKKPESSIKLLNRAIAQDPEYWRYYYIRGFNYWYFKENNKKAFKDFSFAAKLPDAPAFIQTLAGRLLATEKDPNEAIKFIVNLIEQTKDIQGKKALEDNLKLAYVSRDLKILNDITKQYELKTNIKLSSMEQLLSEKLIKYIPNDPYGEPYIFNEIGEIVSRKVKKGLMFHGRTAKTGLASKM